MKIKLYSNKDIRDEGALQVTSSNFFKNNIPDPEGLFSPIIFGITPDEKVKKVGRIDIKRKLIHPLVYTRIFERSFRNINSLIRGDEKFSVVGGKLVSDPENGKTGMDFFISVMDELNLYNGIENEEDSLITKKLKESMKNLTKDDILINQWVVTPLAYRDVSTLDIDLSAIDESNNLYRDLISLSDYYESAKNQPLVNLDAITYKLQMKINGIFEYFEGMTFKKYGIQNKLVLARNIDYSSRLVISAAKFDANNYGTNWVRFDTAGVPLSAVAANGILFALHHSEKVIEDLYNSGGFENGDKTIPLEVLKRDYFNREIVSDMIDHYCSSWGERLNYVNIPETDTPITFKYNNPDGSIVEKPLTLLEFVYMLVYVPIEVGQRCVMCRRYPIQGAFSIISLKTHVLSINKVHPISFMGQEFPYFPDSADMEKELKESKNTSLDNTSRAMKAGHLTTMYDETLVLSNLLMEGYNMDRVVPFVS